MSELELMQSIKTKWGVPIGEACASSSVPPAFLAALIANESGGKPDAKRFEKNVLVALWEVLLGRTPAYGSIGGADLLQHISLVETSSDNGDLMDALHRLDSLATSQGLTQIMGYEVFDFSAIAPTVDKLQAPTENLHVALLMLTSFAKRFNFDLATDFTDLFDCWNTGRPHRPTFDPNYIPNGLARIKIYEALP